jgi:hypothetical protein
VFAVKGLGFLGCCFLGHGRSLQSGRHAPACKRELVSESQARSA